MKRTYRWFTTHDTYNDCEGEDGYYETEKPGDGEPLFKETTGKNLQKALKCLDILDQVPTLDNFRPLVDMYSKWWETVEVSWKNYENGEPHLVALHWILGRVIQHPDIDPEILRYVAKTSPKNIISVVYNPNVPEDLLLEVLNQKKDSTKGTKGGEIGCFILHNKKVSGKVINTIARKTKRIGIQRDCTSHPNVTKETLVWLSREGKNENVKKDARNELVERGMVKI